MSVQKWLQRRECGLRPHFGDKDFIMKRIYQTMEPYYHWYDFNNPPNRMSEYGAVFNLEFSPDGTILVAACEKKSIVLFDAITTKKFSQVTDAHADNVNCIKFLDDRMFASCSDDTTVAIWDLRFLKTKVRSLHGHSNWVKNIEYSHKDNLLVTSGFDGGIFTWDINSHTEQGLIYQKVFHTSGLMRCRISPDGTKLVICTTGGYLMIIHNLDLTTLHKDLCGFRPSMYRLMQMGQQYIPQAAKFDHVFSKKQPKNRVELVTDFPEENDAEVILALQIHPHGHSMLSRNISYDELTEWSCVHDITEEPGDLLAPLDEPATKRKRLLANNRPDQVTNEPEEDSNADGTNDIMNVMNVRRRQRYPRSRLPIPVRRERIMPFRAPAVASRATGTSTNPASPNTNAVRPEWFVPDIWAAEVTVQERAIRQNRARSSNSVTGYNFVYAISSGVLPVAVAATAQGESPHSTNSRPVATSTTTDNEERQLSNDALDNSGDVEGADNGGTSNSGASRTATGGENVRYRRAQWSQWSQCAHHRQIFQNPKKLMYYMQESNLGKGFIKEPCFSADGRIICSPYDTGVRLLAFNKNCSEYPTSDRLGQKLAPTELFEVKQMSSHNDIVLSTKFSPREPLLVTGCHSGNVVWYHPNL